MAKMFYTLEEAAEKLGVSTDEVKKMAEQGTMQQFRDRDKLMFKREQVEEQLAMQQTQQLDTAPDAGPAGASDSDEITIDEDVNVSAGATDTIDLIAETDTKPSGESPKSATATGISVFDADEIDAADPMARTQVTPTYSTDEELTLESVGSGSGLLDLTRESDDTSLGAVELLDDIAPAEGTVGPSGSHLGAAMPGSSTGVFEVAGGGDSAAGAAAPSGLAELEGAGAAVGHVQVVYAEEEADPVGDGLGGGIAFGMFAVLVVCLIVALPAVIRDGQVIQLTQMLGVDAEGNEMTKMYAAGMLLLCIIFGAVGFFIGKSRKG